MRYLAEVCSIKNVETITYKEQTYDKIKKYTLNENAYTFVSAGDFKPNDKVIFIGEGALIPETNTTFEFLRKTCYSPKYKAFRIKPIRMAGEISVGLLMPMTLLKKDYTIGSDVTKELNIRKYEPSEDASPVNTNGKPTFKKFVFKYFPWLARLLWKKSTGGTAFPSWLISKTDEKVREGDHASRSNGRHRRFLRSIFACSNQRYGRSCTLIRNRRMWNKSEACLPYGQT